MTFTIRTNGQNIVVKIFCEPQNDTTALPARCECYRTFKIENYTEPCLIPSQEISSGILIANTIVFEENPVIKVLNTNNEMKTINNKIKNGHSLSEYNIYTTAKIKSVICHESRWEKLRKSFEKTPKHAKCELLELCKKYADIFALTDDPLTTNNFYTQKLRVKTENPVYIKNYRLPKTQKEEIDQQVSKLLKNKLIEPSTSSFNSPLILVPKKSLNGERKWRMCVDYRMLNKSLIADKFPLPRIDDILDSLGRAKHFSVLDLYSGFWQIPLEPNSREMTAFSTDKGSFQWKVLPFGINVAPNSFSRMMSIAFSGLPPETCFIYMDDLIVIGCSLKHHLTNLESVSKICKKYNLKLNPEKFEFFRPEVTFLGHTCTEHGIAPDKNKLEAVEKYPKPTDKDATKRFVAFANYYRRFIPNFAALAGPLHRLTKKTLYLNGQRNAKHHFTQ